MFTVEEVLEHSYPAINRNPLLGASVRPILRRLLHERDFQDFHGQYSHLQGMEFIEQLLEYVQCSYTVSDRGRENIPTHGRVVIVANHPIGSLDGLAVLKLIYEVRSDVRIVANDLLSFARPLRSFLLPITNIGGKAAREQLKNIGCALQNEEAMVIFPAGEVSRMGSSGIRDGKWHKGFLKMAARAKAPILPIHISGKNSSTFYTTSIIAKPLSTLLLINEMFNRKPQQLGFTVGGLIPYKAYKNLAMPGTEKAKLFKRHVYRLGAGKKPLLQAESAIARPERRNDLKKALTGATKLGQTPDGKQIFLLETADSSPIMREIARLREVTFRAVEEGTGKRRDMDRFDRYYSHLVLWDEDDLEIVGAYRFVDSAKAVKKLGLEGLYTDSLFSFDESHSWLLDHGLELGRSFVQRRYWGKRSLDYLWYGIGAYLAQNERFRYLFGPVSISSSMPLAAKELMIYFYKMYFGADDYRQCSKQPFSFSRPPVELAREFSGTDYKKDFKKLKAILSNMGTAVPTLYKQYSELCEPGGVKFLDFNIDPDFGDCIDGLVVVDLSMLKAKKKTRYISNSILK